jgi:hypothetical protein
MMVRDRVTFAFLMAGLIAAGVAAGWCIGDDSVGGAVAMLLVAAGLAVSIGVGVNHALRDAWWRGAGSTARQIHIHHFD